MLWLIALAAVLILILKIWPGGLWLALVCVALLAAGAVFWQRQVAEELALVQINVVYDAALCPAERPLSVTIVNNGDRTLDRVFFSVQARVPGYSSELTPYTYRQYDSSRILNPGDSHSACYRVPPLSRTAAEGVPPGELEWFAEAAKASFR